MARERENRGFRPRRLVGGALFALATVLEACTGNASNVSPNPASAEASKAAATTTAAPEKKTGPQVLIIRESAPPMPTPRVIYVNLPTPTPEIITVLVPVSKTQAPTTPTVSTSFAPFAIAPGETRTIVGPADLQGDVVVDGVTYYDNDPTTGAETTLSTPGKSYTVFAQWGASGEQFPTSVNPVVVSEQASNDAANMVIHGCGSNRCSSGVVFYRVP